MADLQTTDEFLVNRTDTTYTQEQGTLMANLETTDYLLINREDATYKITGEDLINSIIDELEVTVVIAPNPPLIEEDATAIPLVTGGKKPDGGYVFSYQWHYADDLLGTNKVNIPGQTASTYAVQESDIDKFIGCTCTTTDAIGTTATGTGYAGPVSAVEIAPVIDEVILTEIPNGNRYTDKEFPYTTVMTIDGTPDPTYALKARLSGTTFNFGVQSDTITKVEGAGENVYTTDTIASVDDINASVDWVARIETDTTFNPSYPAINAVDGDPNSFADSNAGGTYIRVNLKGLFSSGSHTLSVVSGGATDGVDFITDLETKSLPLASGGGGQTYTQTVSGVPEYIVCKSTTAVSIYYFEIDGEIITNNVTGNQIVLEFPEGATNFDKFEVDDVVQGYNFSDNVEWTGDTFPNNAFDGKTETSIPGGAVLGGKLTVTKTFENVTSFRVYLDITREQVFTINGLTYVPDGWDPSASNQGWWNISTPPSTITEFTIQSDAGSSNNIAAIEINGNILVDTDEYKITDINANATPPTITVDGGDWYGADTTGTVGGETELTKTSAYNTKLTVASDKDLAVITGDIYMTDGTPKQDGSGELEPASYTPVTSTISNVGESEIITTTATLDKNGVITDASNFFTITTGSANSVGMGTPAGNPFIEGTIAGAPPTNKIIVSFTKGNGQAHLTATTAELTVNGKTYTALGETLIPELVADSVWLTGGFQFLVDENTEIQEFKFKPQFDNTSHNQIAAGIWINGEQLLEGNRSPYITLSFASPNPDLQYFRQGDVVQKGLPDSAVYYSTGTDLWTPSMSVEVFESAVIDLRSTVAQDVPTPVNPAPDFMQLIVDTLNGTNTFDFNVGSVSWAITSSIDGITWVSEPSHTFTELTDIRSLMVNQPNGRYIALGSAADWVGLDPQIQLSQDFVDTYISGNFEPSKLPQGDSIEDVTVISTGYPNSNTMVVDGGSWAGPPTQLNTIEVTGYSSLYYIEVDGVALDNLDYVATITNSAGGAYESPSKPLTNIFDADLTNFAQEVNQAGTKWDASSYNITFESLKVQVYLHPGQKLLINGVDMEAPEETVGIFGIDGGGDTFVTGPANTAEGTIASIDGTEVDLSASSGRWIADNKAGTAFSFVPADPIVDIKNEAYGVLQIINDKAQVTGIQASDPGFVNVTSKDYSIKFPSTFATGNAPDADLPMGTAISAIVKAENSAGASIKESNILLPQVPNPEGSAGVITDVEGGGTDVYTTDTIVNVVATTTPFDGSNTAWVLGGEMQTVENFPNAYGAFQETENNYTYFYRGPYAGPNPDAEVGDFVYIDIPTIPAGADIEVAWQGAAGNYACTLFELLDRSGASVLQTYWNNPSNSTTTANRVSVGKTTDTAVRLSMKTVATGENPNNPTNTPRFLGAFSGIWINGTKLTQGLVTSETVLTFPEGATNFDKFEAGDKVQDPNVKIIEIQADATPPTITVDGGSWYALPPVGDGTGDAGNPDWYEPSQQWSDLVTNVDGSPLSISVGSLTDGFDGDTSTLVYGYSGDVWRLDISSISDITKVEAFDSAPVNGRSWQLNGQSTVQQSATPGWQVIYDGAATSFLHLDVMKGSSTGQPAILAYRINSQLLVDSSIPGGAGDTTITKTEVYDNKLTVASPTNLDTFIANDSLVMVDATGAVASYVPVTNTIASVDPLDTGTIYTGQGSQAEGSTSAGREVQKNYLCVLGGAAYTSTAENSLSATSYIKFDTPIVLGKPSTVTIEANGNAGGWVTLNPATYDNNAIPQTAGYTNFANMKGESWNTITFPEQVSVIEGFRWNGVNAGWSNQISNMLIDGAPINPERLTLTFEDTIADNPDLQYFQAGDVVQSPDFKVISTDTTANTMTVDGGSWAGIGGDPAGDTVVTGPAKSGTGTFVSTNDTDIVSVSDSNYEWIANDNRLGEGFYIKKLFTALNANDPAHVAMQQAVNAAFAAFPQNVSTRRTSIASSLYRLLAGEALTAEETAALTSTVTTAVNAAEPFAYDGYYPLYYTADAANAASSVGDHHTHDMDGQTFYMPDGGTIYHGTYIEPEETSGY